MADWVDGKFLNDPFMVKKCFDCCISIKIAIKDLRRILVWIPAEVDAICRNLNFELFNPLIMNWTALSDDS